jgi:hypothetical protein
MIGVYEYYTVLNICLQRSRNVLYIWCIWIRFLALRPDFHPSKRCWMSSTCTANPLPIREDFVSIWGQMTGTGGIIFGDEEHVNSLLGCPNPV